MCRRTAKGIEMGGIMRSRRLGSLVLGVSAAVVLAGVVQATGTVDSVTGSYSYVVFEGGAPRSVVVDAHGTDPIKGTWSFGGGQLSGPVTCLVVDGDQAFMFGPGTVGGRGAFLWVRDGGTPGGSDDEAITWIQDLPGDDLPRGFKPQTLAEMEGWCLNSGKGYPGADLGTVPLISGNLTIHAGS
jgi:hypothetical protein